MKERSFLKQSLRKLNIILGSYYKTNSSISNQNLRKRRRMVDLIALRTDLLLYKKLTEKIIESFRFL